MSELQFIDELPGTVTGRAVQTEVRAKEFRANPGKWALWPGKTAASGVRKSLERFGPGFEVVGRKLDDGKVHTFVRYVEPEAAPSRPAVAAPTNGNGHAAKVKCPTCGDFVFSLADHEQAKPVCRAANKRRGGGWSAIGYRRRRPMNCADRPIGWIEAAA